MNEKQDKINVYIDGANLYRGITDLKWFLDYNKFRVWLSEKYRVNKVYIFLGLVPKYKNLYEQLQEFGYTLIFKETIYDGNDNIKGNCDADLVLKVTKDFYENKFDQAIIVAGDGDYACLVQFLNDKNRLRVVLAPNYKKCSILLKRTNAKITYLNELECHLKIANIKEKAPN